ncbi:MAG: hypothetical protein ACF8NJ_02550 [Phycisphaerales bacterium JB038]
MSKLSFTAALFIAAGTISANVVYIDWVDNGNLIPGYSTFDLMVAVDPGDDWTSASITANVINGEFFQHDVGGDAEPNSALFAVFPALEYDSFFANPPALFDGLNPGFASGPIWTSTSIEAVWFDTLDSGGGDFTLARFTITEGAYLVGGGDVTYRNSGGDLYPYILWPTPGTAAPLLLAGLACRRRQL